MTENITYPHTGMVNDNYLNFKPVIKTIGYRTIVTMTIMTMAIVTGNS